MTIDRRRLLGAFAASAAGLALPRSIAADAAMAEPFTAVPVVQPLPRPLDLTETATGQNRFASVLLPQARAALDRHAGRIAYRDTFGVVDFSSPSRATRFYLVDNSAGQVISTHLVAHGKGSDPANSGWVKTLSNRPGSNASCEGAFATGVTYYGEHGRSRRLIGLEPQNDMAESRAIVIHGANYVDPGMAAAQNRIGRSQGCFAVSPGEIDDVLQLLGPGRLLYAVR